MQDAGKTKDTSINAALHCVCPRANWHTDFKRSLPTKESRTKARRKKNEKIRKRIRRLAERQKTGTTTERPAPPAETPDKWGFDPEEPDVVDAAQGVPAWRRPREALPAWQTHATTEATQIMKSGMHVSNGQSVPAHDSGECALTTEEREGMTTQVNAFVKKGHMQECNRTDLDMVSPFFLQEKAHGKGWRLLLNLEGANAFGTPTRFDMQGMREAMKLMKRGCYFCTADMADAFHSIYTQRPATVRHIVHGRARQEKTPQIHSRSTGGHRLTSCLRHGGQQLHAAGEKAGLGSHTTCR